MTIQDVSPEHHQEVWPTPQQGVRRSRRWRLPVIVGLVIAALVAGGAWWVLRPPPVDDPAVAAEAMATTWTELGLSEVVWATPASTASAPSSGDAASPAAGPVVAPPPSATDVNALLGDLGPDTSLDAPVVVTAAVAAVTQSQDDPFAATATLDVVWELPRDRTWATTSTVRLVRHPGETTWAPVWAPTVVHADMAAGDTIAFRRDVAPRGRILDTTGEVLVGPHRVTEVGLHPARIEDLDEVVTAIVTVMAEELDVELEPEAIRADVAAADPDHFVPVITLRNEDYQLVEPVVFPLVGTSFRDGELFLGPDGEFARFTLGSVGEVTAEQLADDPDRWETGDLAGRSGVQAARDDDLRGTAGWSLVAVRPDTANATLHEVAAPPGRDVTITLDPSLQRAAEAAIAQTGHASAMAVVRPSDGHVLALANSSEATFDIARMGQLPPGSVFKVVTTAALMQQAGIAADTPVGCPNTIDAGGRTISNAGSLALGPTVFSQVFANSCNTSFIDLSRDLAPTALRDAAAQLGVGGDWATGMAAFPGQVPVTEDALDLALTSFGQGRTLVNPLDMATMMASVAAGATVTPTLVTDPERTPEAAGADAATGPDGSAPPGDAVTPVPGSSPPAAGTPLPTDVAATLQDLTRLVVTDGTARVMADTPGDPVHGKTGTAEFTNADGDLARHVWFAGYQGDLAFAVVVTATSEGSGGGTAAPLARAFLDALSGS